MITGNKKNLQYKLGVLLLALLVVFLVAGTIFNGIDLSLDIHQRLQAPSPGHALGTDALGRDIFSCLIFGTAVSLVIALTAVLSSALIGALLGFAAAWRGGLANACIMRCADLILAFPGILLSLALVAFLGPGIFNLILALVCSSWVTYARLVRAEVIKAKEKEFILAARGFNASALRIASSHMAPLVFPLLLTQAVLGMAGVILLESSLNFLGLGLDPRLPSLGQMIDAGRPHLFVKPILIILPGGCLIALIAAFLLLADGMQSRSVYNRIAKKL
ncbi:MAG: ABC transporter permease [Candidatus Aminicenantes bacterium]|nr:ABC transporter permease [Candidatus Aminicenantes bacterium]